MKAITVHQPWATLIARGWKTIETRGHNRFKGLVGQRIAIHASKTYDEHGLAEAQRHLYETDETLAALSFEAHRDMGKVLCTVKVVAHRKIEQIDEREALCDCAGDYGLILDRDVEVLKPPVPAKGGRGIWNWEPPEYVHHGGTEAPLITGASANAGAQDAGLAAEAAQALQNS